VPRTLKNSILAPIMPNRHGMSALPDSGESTPRESRFARWAAQQDGTPPPAAWLFGEPNNQAGELAELRERLAAAEKRAADAEEALPHLLALGQRTVNGLLNDARARGRQIIEDARAQAALEAAEERKALEREAGELDALRMAVACEAMGLEQVRAELEAGVAALQLNAGAASDVEPATVPRQLGTGSAPLTSEVEEFEGPPLPPPPSPADLVSVGMLRSASAPPDSPSSRFADAWAMGEDEMMVEAFDRFFTAHIETDPLRDAVIDSDTEFDSTD
jgi:hypothetical protein